MKKLFSAMLAATMVAGMSVSAFAYVNTKSDWTTDFFDDNDYAVIGAYDEDGKLLKNKSAKLDSGDKIYFPILISGDEIDKDELTEDGKGEKMFFADKASEVKDLKASVKDEVGGKYIDSAAIVKKDIDVDVVKEEGGTYTLDFKGAEAKDTDTKVIFEIGDLKEEVTIDADANDEKIAETIVNDIKSEDKVTINGVEFEIKADDSKIVLKATDSIATGMKSYSIKGLKTSPRSTRISASGKISSTNKVYCVEVKMSDYFKNEETEVEFNIKLKNKGKTEYDTDDDNKLFNGTFDLGKDSFTLVHKTKYDEIECKKFKNGELEIKIGKDTRSVQLDEAYIADGKTKEDITNIYIENDDSIDNAFTFDVKASNQDDLYLELNQDADKDVATANSKADLIFFNFPGEPEFDFSGDATFAVEDEDDDNYFYEIVDGELVETKAKYNEDDGVFELRTNKLTSYVISNKELDTAKDKEDEEVNDTEDKEHEQAGGDATADSSNTSGNKENANTGAADIIGVASALAVVSVAASGVVALKK